MRSDGAQARFVSIGALLWSWLPFVLIAVPTVRMPPPVCCRRCPVCACHTLTAHPAAPPQLYFGRWIAAAVYGGVVGLFLAWFILYSTAK